MIAKFKKCLFGKKRGRNVGEESRDVERGRGKFRN